MDIKIVDRIPLIRIKYKSTEKRVLKIYGNRMCAIYSDLKKKYKRGDKWTEDLSTANILTFNECYEETKDNKDDGIVYCIIRI